jgi:cell division protein FtsI/penicillin-binding protein 2
MYHYRLKILIMLCVGGLIIAVGRLLTLQTFQAKKARQELADMRIMALKQRPTVRGKILDRYGNSFSAYQLSTDTLPGLPMEGGKNSPGPD